MTQIYGLTTVADARDVDRLCPDHVGVVVDEGKDAWDSVDEVTAVAIAGTVENARVVALSLSTDPERIRATTALLRPAVLHLARAHQMESETLARLRDQVAPSELMLTVPVVREEALAVASRLAPIADCLLLDSMHPKTGVVGATGLVHDWSVSARIVEEVACPVVLAGGVGPENVSEAIYRVRPAGVDSETRTSRDDNRRRKDLTKVEAFISHARRDGAS